MTESTERKPNRLVHESSPYLLQHAFNPVDWYPWGEDALQAARKADKPIFLSIGYSACHWCHVMEHESFENPAIAEIMNEHFVNIKVDREERPDLDRIYMSSVLAISGRGGWPMSVFLTPDMKPFYGGTYWPPAAKMGMPGFTDVLTRIAEAWNSQRDKLLAGADELTEAVQRMCAPTGGAGEPVESLLNDAMAALLSVADRAHGGFGGAPKFPHAMDLRVLLRCAYRFNNSDAGDVVKLTLDKMAAGGIYDQLGGGFHRYSTDARWLAPHFEKMLYDNALLTPAYIESAQLTGCAEHARIARETLDYVLAEMTQPEGGFYSTQDADSEGEEGRFFVWYPDELVTHLGADDASLVAFCYDVSQHGNWEGKNILHRVKSDAEAAAEFGTDEADIRERLARSRGILLAERAKRVAPARDDKVIVSWNGMMIAAMARGARYFGDERYAEAARDAADFLLARCRDEGRLLHVFKDGVAKLNAYLDDYACLIDGLVELYQATFEVRHLDEAIALYERMAERFIDRDDGGFYFTSDDHESLIARQKDSSDDATPSGNAMAATALLKLAHITGREDLDQTARDTISLLAKPLKSHPMSGGQTLIAIDFLLGPTHEIVVVEGNDADENREIRDELNRRFLPNSVLLIRRKTDTDDDLGAPVRELLAQKSAVDDRCTVYLCEQRTCREPLVGIEAVQEHFAAD